MANRKCSVCAAENTLDDRGVCSLCEEVSAFLRKRLQADRLDLGNPKRCGECGGPVKPTLFGPDADEGKLSIQFACVRGCYLCLECNEIFLHDQTCPHDDRVPEAFIATSA